MRVLGAVLLYWVFFVAEKWTRSTFLLLVGITFPPAQPRPTSRPARLLSVSHVAHYLATDEARLSHLADLLPSAVVVLHLALVTAVFAPLILG